MKCPRCGNEMTLDTHRKIPLQMCYSCGYIEGRTSDDNFSTEHETNFIHMRQLNFNEKVAFLSAGLNVDEEIVRTWLEAPYEG